MPTLPLLLTALLAFLYTMVFYNETPGLNLLVFEAVLLPVAWIHAGKPKPGFAGSLLTAGVISTAVAVFFHGSAFSVIINVLSLGLWSGWLVFPAARSLVTSAGLAVMNFFRAPWMTARSAFSCNKLPSATHYRLRQVVILIIPIPVALLFILLYQNASPWFAKLLRDTGFNLEQWIEWITGRVNFELVFFFITGLWIASLFILPGHRKMSVTWESASRDELQRTRVKRSFRGMKPLIQEYRTGVVLLVMLNVLILIQNLLDAWYVWFDFQWNGQYLRQFVHEGTWLLLFSVILSAAVILALFRGNLNFLSRNRWLKYLTVMWIIQNLVLVLSVAARNYWYIHYFALAYKRIGVIIFLVLVFIGLLTVLLKVLHGRSFFFLLRINAFSLFVVLVSASLIDWDGVIARYNFSHYRQSYVHLDWLCTLSGRTLPLLDKTPAELKHIRQVNDSAFSFDFAYMSPDEYHRIIQSRKKSFVGDWESRGFWSFNVADYRAFMKITGQGGGNR